MILPDWVVGGIGGATLVAGLSSWLGKVWAGRILAKDRAKYKQQVESFLEDLRTRNNKELFVHHLQFDKEFETYKGLWKAALAFARVARNFRSIQTGEFIGSKEILAQLAETGKVFVDAAFDNRPFYAPEVYQIAKRILDLAQDVALYDGISKQLKTQGTIEPSQVDTIIEMSSENEKRLNEINTLIDDLCAAIRKQVRSTKDSA